MITTLDGSTIVVKEDIDVVIIIPAKKNIFSYIVPLFLLLWLGGWCMGEVSAIHEVISGKGGLFIIFWLCGWTLGGIFAAFSLYKMAFGTSSEKLVLKQDGLLYDSGNGFVFDPSRMRSQMQNGTPFKKRTRLFFDLKNIESIKASTELGYHRIIIDKGIDRVELGSSLTEIEREWLVNEVKKFYGIV